jgi:hypothetical protein
MLEISLSQSGRSLTGTAKVFRDLEAYDITGNVSATGQVEITIEGLDTSFRGELTTSTMIEGISRGFFGDDVPITLIKNETQSGDAGPQTHARIIPRTFDRDLQE